ncbi:MAG: glycerol-3-phosphate dehydrogenase subunit GlpB [Proteobacteria bacterium]|nr:glycerol-3-phosphate dehydrogenase subunit GlpB [Pseudomonadota bacterium]MBU1584405.1 glycerol-3-phosphate dehydrogenase subunit GlpB [Pseudomonadota bacterium]MBU2454744.1 glycerol-3-phosphate dehydrogenase subunit GlpB [Pseudomonadota bacterium]MBU2628894.1 glycerol-3-phosphate dehydrogenase subunit GlpB [Pseudomonadota bacterium]
MKDKQNITCDLLIIGAGFAGMVAAACSSSLGLNTVQVGNSSELFLASGLFDLLGVYPTDPSSIIKNPGEGLKKLQADIPDHPYSKTSYENIIKSFEFLKQFLESAGLKYHSSGNKNTFILTSAGTFKPTFMVPQTFVKGCQIKEARKRVLFVNFKGLREFSAKQIANVIHNTGIDTSILTIELPDTYGGLNPVQLAGLFEDSEFLDFFSKKIIPFSDKTDLVGIPAVCGIHKSLDILTTLEKMTGLDFFEIPGLPPSVPGLRLKNAFEKKLSQNNVIFLSNSKITAHTFEDHHFILTAANQNTKFTITAKGVILATGRFPGGGLHAKRDQITETVFNLPVYQPEQRNLWHKLNFFDPKGHSINTAGLETDASYRPVDTNRNPIFENLYAIGTLLAHNDWVRLKSGSGVSCVTACTAVNDFYHNASRGH